MADPREILPGVEGEEIPGGCIYCEAFQTVTQRRPGAWTVVVHHQPDCRTLR